MKSLGIILLWLVLLLPAKADYLLTRAGTAPAAASYVGPQDAAGVSPSVCYSIQACSASIASAGTTLWGNLYNSVTTELCDDKIATNGGFGLTVNCTGSSNGETVAAFCGGNNCLVELYAQISDGTLCSPSCNTTDNITRPPTNRFPLLLSGCPTTSPCLQGNSTSFLASSGSGTLSLPLTSITLAYSSGSTDGLLVGLFNGSGNTQIIRYNVSGVATAGNSYNGSVLSYTLPNSAWESVATIMNGSSSSVSVSGGTPTTGNTGTVANTGENVAVGAFGVTSNEFIGYFYEILLWNGTALTSTETNAVCNNENTRFGLSLSPC